MKAILNVLVTADRISHATNAVLKPHGISKEQFNVLRILKGQQGKPISMQEIARRMISKSSNATRLVEKLHAKELVQRNPCAADRRQLDITITRKGEDLLDVVGPLVFESSNSMRTLSEAESQQLNQLLEKMRG